MSNRASCTAAIAAGFWIVPAFSAAAAPTLQAPAPAQGRSGVQAPTSAPTPLDRYLKNLKTLRVTFLQTVADATGAEIGRSTGTLIVERPGKFSWDIHPQSVPQGATSAPGAPPAKPPAAVPGGGQLMVSDGRNLWYLDRDLQQVTVR
ncbi:MAG: outer membrane lipoprotein carrier protein LolA, partial [Steroidobacteraceae bacterium]